MNEPLDLKSILACIKPICVEQYMKLGACGGPWWGDICSTVASYLLEPIIELKLKRNFTK